MSLHSIVFITNYYDLKSYSNSNFQVLFHIIMKNELVYQTFLWLDISLWSNCSRTSFRVHQPHRSLQSDTYINHCQAGQKITRKQNAREICAIIIVGASSSESLYQKLKLHIAYYLTIL